MIKELLKRAIEQKNAFMSEDLIYLQIEFFLTAGKISEVDKAELLALMRPIQEPPSEEPPQE